MRSGPDYPFLHLILLIGLNTLFLPSGTAQWELQKEKDGISVFTRKVDNSPFKASKAVAVIEASPDRIVSELKKGNQLAAWLPKTDQSTILHWSNPDEYFAYFTHPAPWPVSDRDEIIHYRFEEKEDGSFHIYLRGVADYLPPKSDYVRIPYSKGQWQLLPFEGNKTQITLINHFDPGGTVPAYLLNSSVIDSPIETINNLKKRLQ
jgi:hypothetical protein